MPRGAGRAWGLAPTGREPLGRRGNDRQRPGRSTCVRTVAGGVGSLMSGARLAVGGRGGQRRGRAWAYQERKMGWAEPG
jgi:hypothetical protein